MERLATGTGNNSASGPETAGFRGYDALTFEVDLLKGAGHYAK